MAFEDKDSGALFFAGEKQLLTLANLPTKPKLVFLSMCYGEPVARIFSERLGIKHVVTVRNDRILDAVKGCIDSSASHGNKSL